MWFCQVVTKTFNKFYFQNIAKGGIATRRSNHYSPKDFKYSKFRLYPLQWLVNCVCTMIIFDVLPYTAGMSLRFQFAGEVQQVGRDFLWFYFSTIFLQK